MSTHTLTQTVYRYQGRWHVYTTTRGMTKYHAFLCKCHEGRTYINARKIITEFIPGMPLWEPLVIGGTEITGEQQ